MRLRERTQERAAGARLRSLADGRSAGPGGLIEGDGAGGRDIQALETARHGDLGKLVAVLGHEAAQAFAASRNEGELGWRSHLSDVRRAAVRLADAGRLVIYRKGKPVDPHDFRGVYRLGAPSSE